jgi:hypothetical protein
VAISLAREENAMLWTDDFFVGSLSEYEFGIKRIWSQLVFKVLECTGIIDSDSYSSITAKLVGWHYVTTVWNPQDIITAGNLCGWDVNMWPLKKCLKELGAASESQLKRAQITLEYFKLLRHSSCNFLLQSSVIQTTLNYLGDPNTVQRILQDLDNFFGIDYPSARFFRFELFFWLNSR